MVKAQPADEGDQEPQQTIKLDIKVCIKDKISWAQCLNQEYFAKASNGKEHVQTKIKLDNCPACGGLGFIGDKNGDGYACPTCLTGKLKHEGVIRLPYYKGRPACSYKDECPFTNETEKQLKCNKCDCKFDKKGEKQNLKA